MKVTATIDIGDAQTIEQAIAILEYAHGEPNVLDVDTAYSYEGIGEYQHPTEGE